MFEITGEDISNLNDADLRTLIALLCEADLRSSGLSTAGVTWGGNQDAKDGGIDVRVSLDRKLPTSSFIPSSITGFQVKRPDMSPKAIYNEMCPGENLRPAIKELLDSNGAYVIASSRSSTSDTALKNRKKAMYEALKGYPNASNLKLDFYDSVRIASWVRSHPSLIIWVREKNNRKLNGWKSFGNWSRSPKGIAEEYLLDEQLRVYHSSNIENEGKSVEKALNEIRIILHEPKSSVRIVGLSGVGKTRFVQALFDERISDGSECLNKSQVFYTDLSDSPEPNPIAFAEYLVALSTPAILVIDNCNPQLHKRLNEVCLESKSSISLITIEYDVRDDLSKETEVYRLEASSEELIVNLIRSRYEHISEVDNRTIAKFSGGNARIAIALSATIRQGENLGNLRDAELFDRLFHQRNENNNELKRVAEVCSLLYSFNIETVETEDAINELKILGSLINMEIEDVYRNVKLLERRQLVQERSKWRAVLPHAIANRLAKSALETIPVNKICSILEGEGCERLLKSFSRRLSYLHDSEEANQIASRWLHKNGLLSDVEKLDQLHIDIFKNIAPVNPSLSIKAIERVLKKESKNEFFSRKNVYFNKITTLLTSLAYDSDLFTSSTELLCRFAISEQLNENNNSVREKLNTLFYMYLSGTHATAIQRLQIIRNLIENNSKNEVDLGFSLLSSTLKTNRFSSYYNYEFGAHSRNYGYMPNSRKETEEWYRTFIDYIANLAISSPYSKEAKLLLANKFRGLWTIGWMHESLEEAALAILGNSSWIEGYLAVKSISKYHVNEMNEESSEKINRLLSLMKPNTLIDRIELFVMTNNLHKLDLIDLESEFTEKLEIDRNEGMNLIVFSLAEEAILNQEILNALIPTLLTNQGIMISAFGEGLANACTSLDEIWKTMYKEMISIAKNERNYDLIKGFLTGTARIDRERYDQYLDFASHDAELMEIYPYLQNCAVMNSKDIKRLKDSLMFNDVSISHYKALGYGKIHEAIKNNSLCMLLTIISSKLKGQDVAIYILSMQLHRMKIDSLSKEILLTGQKIIAEYNFENNENESLLFHLSYVIKKCFSEQSKAKLIQMVCDNVINATTHRVIRFKDYSQVIEAIIETHPVIFLDSFLKQGVIDELRKWQLSNFNPLNLIEDSTIIAWCNDDPIKILKVAYAIDPFKTENEALEWTPLALELISKSKNPIDILNIFKHSLKPNSWWGSRATIMKLRLKLLLDLQKSDDIVIVNWAKDEERLFEKEIESEEEWELEREKQKNESFE